MPTIRKTLRILEFIRHQIALNRQAPTIQEIANEFNMRSTGSVHRHLVLMQDRGWIERTREWRGIKIIKPERKKAA